MQFVKSSLFRFGTLFVIVLFVSGCSDSDDEQGSAGGSSGTVIPTGSTSTAVATTDLNTYLTTAIYDEYKARDTYQAIIDKFGNVRPFVNIKKAEEQHIGQLAGLFNTYGLSVPSDSVGGLAAPASVSAACSIGVQAEIANGDMYNGLLAGTTAYSDVQAVFKQLQSASLNQHLPAFQGCAN